MHERDLLIAAFEIDDLTARREYLDKACSGNVALRDRVERLLNRATEAGDFLEQPANDFCSDFVAGLPAETIKPTRSLPCETDDLASNIGTLFGRYRVERELGSGGMGAVYLAEDLRLGRRVALKIPKFDADSKLRLSQRFRREARTMASVQHRNLCPIFDVDEQDGTHYLTMSFIDGEPLSQIIQRGTSFTARQIAELIRKLALGLEAAHRAGVVHRDLKPANVMIDRDGEPILMDFGLAWLVHEADSRVTQTGAVIGTPAYMSPEQAEGDPDKVGSASDIYSLGVILYELITGRPIRSGSVKQALFKLMHEIPARPSEIRSDVDPRLEEICCKAIASRPEDRFATAAEFAEALASFNIWAIETLVEPRASELRTGERHGSADKTGVLPQDEITIAVPKPQVARYSKWRIVLVSLLLLGVFGAVWARIDQLWKRETPKPNVADSSNFATPALQSEDREVRNLPRAVEPSKPPVLVDLGKPFVVVREKQDVRSFKTLSGAINDLQPGDVIEIRSSERLPIQLSEPVMKPLAIRAGMGYRPWLAFAGPEGNCDLQKDFSVEGCDLDLRSIPFTQYDPKYATWRFHRCRMWGDPAGCVSKMRISESLIISVYGINAPTNGIETDYEFDNCLIRCSNLLIRYAGSSSHTLRLRNCTFYAVAGGHPRLAHLRESPTLTVEATGNVFHCQSQSIELIDPQSLLRVTWLGADNCFSGTWYRIWEGNVVKEKGLPAWNKLWKEPERDSREVDFLAFEWGRIQRLPNPERSLAVRAATEKMIAEHKLPEVGPDWNLVGPGDAYVRALAAEGRAVPKSELRLERRDDGAIVLLRAGKEVRGYLTLKPALDAAEDKDVIELRTDGLVKDIDWTGDSRLLTIRAGAGYTPTIDFSLHNLGTDRLILEGLTIRHVLQASGGVSSEFSGGRPLYPTQGSLVRMMNCTGLAETSKCCVDAWMIGDGDSIPEIVNCNFGTLRMGIRSGGTARLRNSVFGYCRPNVESRTAQPGTLEIERCLFWLPEPAVHDWTAAVLSLSAIKTQAHRSIFVSPVELTNSNPHLVDWTGSENVFVKPHAFQAGQHPIQLQQFQTKLQTEANSIELPPWEFDPAQWRILRDKSPGYQPRPDGTDYGANIDRLINAMDRDAARPAIAPFDDKQAKAHQAAWAKSLGVPVEYSNSLGMKFVLIPPGEFTMGGTPMEIEAHLTEVGDDTQWQDRIHNEAPQHKVVLTKPTFLSVDEVTQKEYESVMGTNPAYFSSTGTGKKLVANLDTQNHPVEQVTWNQAIEFCARLNEIEKQKPSSFGVGEVVIPATEAGYRLPTEAQWEFACRAGSTTKYWSGDADTDLSRVGWFIKNSRGRTNPVGKLPANPFGLHDLHGNVWEWVEDVWEPNFYERFTETPVVNPIGSTSSLSHRVLRGGGWGDSAMFSRSSCRHAFDPSHSYLGLGFRVSLSVNAVKEFLKRDQQPAAATKRIWSEWPADAPPPALAPFSADRAAHHQMAWAKYLDVTVEYENSIGMKFVLIPPGEFTMGSAPADIEAALLEVGDTPDWRESIQSEAPQHKVVLTKPFYLGVHEVTQAEYEQVMGQGSNRSWFAPMGSGRAVVAGLDTAAYPVEMVSWNDAVEFCTKLSQRDGHAHRLPTEAQWEFACRAGTIGKYCSGDSTNELLQAGWFDRSSARRPHAVGMLSANPFGLHDMHGNVWEWVQDAWSSTDYAQFQEKPAIDPIGVSSGGPRHVLRGAHWRSTALICRASARYAETPAFQPQNCVGFRVLLDVDAAKAAAAKRAQ